MKSINVNRFVMSAQTAKLFAAIFFALIGFFLFLFRAKSGINLFEFGDETEKFVAAQLINSGMKLYLDIFAHHGPILYMVSHAYSVTVDSSDFSQIRWFMVGLALFSTFSVYSSPVFKSLTIRLFATGLFLGLLSTIWALQSIHMILYHPIGGLLFIILFTQLFLPLLYGSCPTRWGLILTGFCTVTMCFTAYAFGPSVVFLLLSAILMSMHNSGWIVTKDYLISIILGASSALVLILIWLYIFADIKGFFVYHFYFNQEIYSQFIGFSLKSVKNLFSIEFNPNKIIHSFVFIMFAASVLLISGISSPTIRKKNGIVFYLSFFLFVLSVVFLSPRGGTGFHGAGFLVASLAVFSASSALFLQKINDDFSARIFFRTLFGFLFIFFIFEKASSDAVSSPHRVKKVDFRHHSVHMRPTKRSSIIKELASHDKDFLALIFNPSIYITNGKLPASGHYYYLPWQAAYNRRSIDGYRIDICDDIRTHHPSVIWFDNWKVWNRYLISEYEPCVPEIINADYIRLNESAPLFVRSDRLIKNSNDLSSGPRKMIVSKQLEKSSPIQLHLSSSVAGENNFLEKIGVMFGTYIRHNAGEAELVLTSSDGTKYRQKFSLSELIDKQYKYFNLEVHNVVAAEVRSLSGGGVSAWESHNGSGDILTCINYIYSGGKISLTPGCP